MDANFTARSIAQITNEELLQAVVKMCKDLNRVHKQEGVYNLYDTLLRLKKEAQTDRPNLETLSG